MQAKRFAIGRRVLFHLYHRRRLNTLEIARIVGLSQRTTQIRMKECGIELRQVGANKVVIDDDVLRDLYSNQRLSSRVIAKKFGCAYSTIDRKIRDLGVPLRNLAEAHIKTTRREYNGGVEMQAYLVGFRIGDLRVRKMYKHSETILIDCASTRIDQIEHIKKLFDGYGRIWIGKPNKKGAIQIEIGCNKSFSFLLDKPDVFPKWIEESRELRWFALAGFIDAEGCFYVGKKEKACFSLGNYNTAILRQIQGWINDEGIYSRLYMGRKKGYVDKDGYIGNQDYWMLTMNRKADLYRFTQKCLIYMKYTRKISDANRVTHNIVYRNMKFGLK